MQYGLDMVSPPTPDQAEQMVMRGWTFTGVYVGGPRAASRNQWHQQDGSRYPVRDLVPHFSGFLPIYVGRNAPWDDLDALNYDQGQFDGVDANVSTGACGFDETSPLCLDVEYQTYADYGDAVVQYVLGWVREVNRAGHTAGIYGSIAMLNALELGEQIDFKWGAAWTPNYKPTRAPIGGFDPKSPPPWDIWQFAGATIAGVSVDCNSATDSFVLARYAG